MIKVVVKINGKDYTLMGRENEGYLKEVAEYFDGKIAEVKSKNQLLSLVDATVLAGINISDELYKVDSEITRISNEKDNLKLENEKLQNTLKDYNDKIEFLNNNTTKISDGFNEKLLKINDEIKVKDKEKASLMLDKENYQRIINSITDENNKIKQDLKQVEELSELLNKEILKVKEEKRELLNKIEGNQKLFESKEKEISEVIDFKEILEKKLEESTINQDSLNKVIEETKNENNLLASKVESLEAEIEELRNKNQGLVKQMVDLKKNSKGHELTTAKYKNLDLSNKLLEAQFEIAKLKNHKNPLIKVK